MVVFDGWYIVMGKGYFYFRNYGIFFRVLGYFVWEKKVLSLEEVICKMMSLLVSLMGLIDWGEIVEG